MNARPASTARIAVLSSVLVLAAAAGTACSSSTSSTTSSGTAPSTTMCNAVHNLQQSVSALSTMQVGQNGVAAIRGQLNAVRADLRDVFDNAQQQYTAQTDKLHADVADLRAHARAARENPTPETLAAVRVPLTTLVDDVGAFAHQVSAGCH